MAGTKRLVYEFFGLDAGATATFDRMEGNLARGATSWSKYAMGAGVAVAAVAVYAVKQAADFQKSTEMIHTQAGKTVGYVDQVRKGILGMAASVGTGPEQLSEAMFHIASTGLSASKSLQELRAAAEGAQIGNADLTDVTNALNATVVSGIKGAGNFAHAMGALNAIVGAGDMHMQDLADALGSGVLAVMKPFGVTLTESGAALATFGDNNIRGAQAATYLRQTVQSITAASPNADKALSQIGLTAQDLQDALANKGLSGALQMLHDHFANSGLAANKWGDVLEQAFTKKAGVGISLLVGQFGRFQTKQAEVAAGANQFGDDWTATTKNLSFQLDRMRAGLQADAIAIGNDLLPAAMDLLKVLFGVGHGISETVGWLKKNETAVTVLAAVIGAALLPKLIEMGAIMAKDTLVSFANGLAAVTLKLIGTKSAMGEVNDRAGMMAGALNPVTAAVTIGVGTLTYAWMKNREEVAKEKAQVDSFTQSLNTNHNSVASLQQGVQSLTAEYGSMIRLHDGAAASGHSDIAGLIAKTGAYQEATKQIADYKAQVVTVTRNSKLMGNEFGLTAGQVLKVADAIGPNALTGKTKDAEAAFASYIAEAQKSHRPNQQANSDFQDMSSSATDLSTALQDLSDAWDNYIGNFTNLKEQQDSFNAGLRTLQKDLGKSGNSIRDNGKAATTARDDFLGLVDKIGQVTSATYKNASQQDKAVAAAGRMRDSLKSLGVQGPLVTKELQKLDSFINSFANKAGGQGARTGQDYVDGVLLGLKNKAGALAAEAAALGSSVDTAFRSHEGISAHSPSRKGHQSGKDYAQGVANGLKDSQQMVTLASQKVARLLDEGLTNGWTGAASRIKNALSTQIQNALTAYTDHFSKEISKQQQVAKAAEATFKSMEQARRQAISSLAGNIAGSADLSNVLNQQTPDGSLTYTGNVRSFLTAQLGPLKAEAAGLAKLRKMGLSQALLTQISAMQPTDAVTVINQILSGQDGSVASLNTLASQIRAYAKQSATTVVESPHEKQALRYQHNIADATRHGVHVLERLERHMERMAAHAIAGNVTVNVHGHTTKVSNQQGVEIVKTLKRLKKQGIFA